MNKSALWILVGVVFAALIGFAATYFVRLSTLRALLPEAIPSEGLLNKDAFYTGGIWLTSSIAIFASIGMSIPLVQSLAGKAPKVVEERLYHQVLVWPYLPLMLLLAVAPLLSWRPSSWKDVWVRIANPLAFSIGLTGLLLIWVKNAEGGLAYDTAARSIWFGKITAPTWWWIGFLSWFSFFVFATNVASLLKTAPKDWVGRGGLVAHLGLAMTMFGLIGSHGYEKKTEAIINQAYPSQIFGHDVAVTGRTASLVDPDNKIRLAVQNGSSTGEVRAGLYYFTEGGGDPKAMTWPAIVPTGVSDFYYVLHELTFEATDEMTLAKGQVGVFKGLGIEYDGYKMEGQGGQAGTAFVADVQALTDSGSVSAHPAIQIVGGGKIDYVPDHLTDQIDIKLKAISVADKSATFQLFFRNPAYPATIYYKPLTRFVWIGVGIMTLGGLMAAFARRYKPGKKGRVEDQTSA